MSAQDPSAHPRSGRYQRQVKSAGGPRSRKERERAHNTAFGDLHEQIEKEYDIPGHRLPYWDPVMKTKVDGKELQIGPFHAPQAIDLKKSLYEKWKPVYEEINRMTWDGANLAYAAEKAIEKAMQRSNFSIPVFFTPEVYETGDEDTPAADMISRVAVTEDTIDVDERTAIGSASSFNEGASSWPSNDDTIANHSYDVDSYGRENQVSDFVQLAAQGLRSTTAFTEEGQVMSIRQYEEGQLLIGQATNLDTTGNVSANDSTGFLGFPDIVQNTSDQINDEAGAAMTIQKVRQANKYLRREARASRQNIVHFTDHTTFEDLKSDLTDFTRYDTPGDELSFGFDAIVIDNTPIMETHGLPDSDNDRIFASIDMGSVYMGMLQDVTLHPLARDSPNEDFATDAYGTLVGRSDQGIHYYEGLA